MAKLNSAEENVLNEILEWKSQSPGFLNKATHILAKPLVWVGDKLIPEEAREKLSEVTEKVVDKLQDLSQWTVNPEDVLKATREFEIDSDTILSLRKASIFDLDHVAQEFTKRNAGIAAAEGFGTGLIGWPGLIADMPALFTLSFRLVYQHALCYGFLPENTDEQPDAEEFEVGYMLRVFHVATAATRETRMQALLDLKNYESDYHSRIGGELGHDFARRQLSKTAAIQVSRIIVAEIIKGTFARKAVTALPGIGALLTAGFNYAYVQDVGEAAFMLYRERFLNEKKGRKKVVIVPID